jgi:Na+-translocating ferredoxin:NAD+ oxidoreductase RnfD subunit
MLRYLIILLLTVHGFTHFMGFAKAFQYAELNNLTMPISKPFGILWVLSALLFLTSAIMLLLKKRYWWTIAIPAAVLSQFAIFASWNDARFGTIANAIIVVAIIFGWAESTSIMYDTTSKNHLKKNQSAITK